LRTLVAEVHVNDVLIDTLVRNQSQAVPNWVSAEVTVNADNNGEITVEFISLSDTVGGGIILDDIELTPSSVTTPDPDPIPAPAEVVYAINAGGSAYTSIDELDYTADFLFDGGFTFGSSNPIAGTADDTLYQSERWGPFSYNLPIENGDYVVTLQFAEIFYGSSGQRVFSVEAEDQAVISDLDLVATAGPNTAFDQSFTVNVTDGVLNLHFSASVDNAKLSALLVTTVGSSVNP